MRLFFLIFLFLINIKHVSQKEVFFRNYPYISGIDTIIKKQQEEIVYTPFGPTLKSNLHFVDSKQRLNVKGDSIQMINAVTGNVTNVFNNRSANKNEIADPVDGWITYASCNIYKPTLYFSADFKVPSNPMSSSDQLLYLFCGLGGGGEYARILQPVLQWGLSPAGGGDYWAICNWYVTNNGQFFYDSLIKVDPGTNLTSIIKQTSFSEDSFNYKSEFAGYPNGLQVNNIDYLGPTFVAFEAYNVDSCDEYPIDEKIKFSNIQISTDYSPVSWWSYDKSGKPKMTCGQFTKIVNNSSNNGQIDIHFHSPYSIDNFEEIHIYPNPVKTLLHISPNRIKSILPIFPDEIITNCGLEIIDAGGKLIRTYFYELFDDEFNLDLSYLKPGIYFLRFSYNNNDHVFQIIKI